MGVIAVALQAAARTAADIAAMGSALHSPIHCDPATLHNPIRQLAALPLLLGGKDSTIVTANT